MACHCLWCQKQHLAYFPIPKTIISCETISNQCMSAFCMNGCMDKRLDVSVCVVLFCSIIQDTNCTFQIVPRNALFLCIWRSLEHTLLTLDALGLLMHTLEDPCPEFKFYRAERRPEYAAKHSLNCTIL